MQSFFTLEHAWHGVMLEPTVSMALLLLGTAVQMATMTRPIRATRVVKVFMMFGFWGRRLID